ncbi:MAG: hypothetical protein FJX65_01110 [Alphaproteobacteria bacterium]|nr:hypothetical protein [Alphaproteobacteria bacterium]
MSEVLDVTGLKCPLPVLRAKKALKTIEPGMTLMVLATDPSAVKDFQAFCETTGDTLVSQTHAEGVFTFVIRRR